MIRNIILIDRGNTGDFVKRFLELDNINIVILVTQNEESGRVYEHNKKVKKVLIRGNGDVYNKDGIENIDYEIINKFKHIQLDFELGTGRAIKDYAMLKDRFYNSLFFWHGIFSKENIDAVIVKGLIHGMSDDCIPIGIAKYYGIKCYTIRNMNLTKFAIFDELKDNFIKKSSKRLISLNEDKFYKIEDMVEEIERSSLYRIFYKIGGSILVNILLNLKHRNIHNTIYKMKGEDFTTYELIYNYIKMKCLKKYLKKISCKPNYTDKYIIYYLHLEPEATNQVQCILKSQLIAIKMLAKSLPKGWILYVKEHPHQFELNREELFYFLYSGMNYKTKMFYKEIKSYDNIKIINRETSSELLSKNAKAIATLNGTVALEAIDINKPVLLFSGETTVYQYIKDAYLCINSFEKCKIAVEKIANGWTPDYTKAIDIFSEYYYDIDELQTNIVDDIIRLVWEK